MFTTTITLTDYSLNEVQLESLVRECCGHILEVTADSPLIEIEFEDAANLDFFNVVLNNTFAKSL